MRSAPILAILAIALTDAARVEAATNQFDLTGGVAPTSRTDRLLSPLQYTGNLPSIQLGWSLRQPHALQSVSLGLQLGQLSSGMEYTYLQDGERREASPSPITVLDIRYAYGRRVGSGKWDIRVGATQYTHLEQFDWVFGFNGHGTYAGALELAPWVDARVSPGQRHHVELEAWVPLLTWVARSPYAIHDDQYLWHNRDTNPAAILVRYIGAGKLRTPMDYQAVHARGSWAIDLNQHFAVLVAAQLDLFSIPDPRPLAELQLTATAGVRGSF